MFLYFLNGNQPIRIKKEETTTAQKTTGNGNPTAFCWCFLSSEILGPFSKLEKTKIKREVSPFCLFIR
jgi:hypothetical protein